MKDTPSPEFHTVCRVDDVPVGEARMFVIGDAMIGVFNLNGDYYALENACPHAGASLAHGLLDGETVSCRIHHWRFSIRDGTYLDADKPECNAKSFPVRIVGDDVQVAFAT